MGTPDDQREQPLSLAQRLLDAYARSTLLEPITTTDPTFDEARAYEVLEHITADRQACQWVPVGRKIGFTNRTIWRRYGVTGPMWAQMWDRTVRFSSNKGESVALSSFVQPRIEPEVVFGLLRSPPITSDVDEILACVEWMAAGFEIVQCHFPDWRFNAPDCIADFGLHGALIVGKRVELTDRSRPGVARSLRTFQATLAQNGSIVDTGTGANVLDSPALALGYLTRVLGEQPLPAPLTAGEIITTGTLTDAWPVKSGETWTSDYGSLGLEGLTLTFE